MKVLELETMLNYFVFKWAGFIGTGHFTSIDTHQQGEGDAKSDQANLCGILKTE